MAHRSGSGVPPLGGAIIPKRSFALRFFFCGHHDLSPLRKELGILTPPAIYVLQFGGTRKQPLLIFFTLADALPKLSATWIAQLAHYVPGRFLYPWAAGRRSDWKQYANRQFAPICAYAVPTNGLNGTTNS